MIKSVSKLFILIAFSKLLPNLTKTPPELSDETSLWLSMILDFKYSIFLKSLILYKLLKIFLTFRSSLSLSIFILIILLLFKKITNLFKILIFNLKNMLIIVRNGLLYKVFKKIFFLKFSTPK